MAVTVEQLRAVAAARLADVDEGAALNSLSAALIHLGVTASVTCLDAAAIEAAIDAALDAGASAAQAEETLALVSGLGVHSLMVALPPLLRRARARSELADGTLDPARQTLWDATVGDDPFWQGVEREMPGFLDAMLRLSPETFRAFFDYCAVPWRGGTVRARTKELVAMACDATPAHRFAPGFRLHMNNALKLGAGRRAVLQALDIAASCPAHDGA